MRPLPKRKSQKPTDVRDVSKVVELPPIMDQTIRLKRRYGRSVVTGILAILLLGGAGLAYKTIGLNASQNIIAERVLTGTVSYNSFNETIPVNATVIPKNTVFLDTVEGGRVMELHVEDGAIVTAGTPLVTLKNTDLELQVIGREAQYTQQLSNLAQSQIAFDQSQLRYDRELMDAQLQIDLTRASLERRLPIEQTGVSQSEIDRLRAELNHQEAIYKLIEKAKQRDTKNATRNLNQLKQSVGRMEDSVDIMRGSLDQLTLRAPIDGRVSALTLQSGQFLAPGSRVGQVDVSGAFKVRAYVNEFYLNRLTTGHVATAMVAGQKHNLTVSKIYPTIANRQFEMDLLFNNDVPENLRRGQNVRVRVVMGDTENALTIPTGPYEATTGSQWVFVLSADGKTAQRREIKIGRKSPDQIEVLSGLRADETIITSSYDAYGDNQNITLSNSN
jgi:HlyD family secretion protein